MSISLRLGLPFAIAGMLTCTGLGILPTACAQRAFGIAQPQSTPTHFTSPDLQQKTWQLQKWQGIEPLAKTTLTLNFTDKSFSGSAGCNRFRGNYQSQEKTLKIDPAIASTRRACQNEIMKQESRFLQALSQVTRFELDPQGNLILFYGKNETMVFANSSTSSALEKNPWRLVRLDQEAIAVERPPTLEFKNKALSGMGGCNRLVGQFEQNGNKLKIKEPLASTMMACPEPEMALERKFTQALVKVNRYEINRAGELVLYLDSDADVRSLTFLPQGN